MSELQVVVFSLNGQLFGVEALQVSQIIKYQELSKSKKMLPFIDGVISHMDDRALPVINLARRFQMENYEPSRKSKILVINLGEKLAGFIVDDVTEIVRFDESEVEPAPVITSNEAKSYITKVGKRGEKLISIIDFMKVLTGDELSKL